MAGAVSDLMLDRMETLSETQKQLLALEFQNVTRRYLSTCTDHRYGNKFFGLKKASEGEKRQRACQDIWESSRGIALAAGEERSMRLWCDAVAEAYLDFDPEGRKRYEVMEEKYSG